MADQSIIDRIIAIGRRRRRAGKGTTRKHIKAALETGAVESNFENLPGGDADSQGWRQERASLYPNPRNLKASINRFYDEAKSLDRGQRAGELAADVQRPAAQYRDRYAEHSDEASRLLRQSRKGRQQRPAGGPQGASAKDQALALAAQPTDTRRALLQQYVLSQDEDPNALVNLALGLRDQEGQEGQEGEHELAGAPNLRPRREGPQGATKALGWAESKLGKKEATGANDGKLPGRLNRKFGMSNQPWCAMFTSYAVTKGGAPSIAKTASVAAVRAKAKAGQGYHGFVKNAKAKPGDLILWGDDHIAMVKSVSGGKINYVGGNQSNAVTRGSVSVNDSVEIVRPKYKGF